MTQRALILWMAAVACAAAQPDGKNGKAGANTPPPAQKGAPAAGGAAGIERPAEHPAMLSIAIEASRSPLMRGARGGLTAEIRNVSQTPLLLKENQTVFVVTPELRTDNDMLRGCATFPTEGIVRTGPRPRQGYEVLLQPGDNYRVYWDMDTDGCDGKHTPLSNFSWASALFSPGSYKAYLDVHFVAGDKPTVDTPYHTRSEGKDIVVAASLWVILAGAFIGGLLAYVIKLYYGAETKLTPTVDPGTYLGKGAIPVEGFLAGLYGCVLVILASRLPDTFPIKVNANDLLGAIALGFVFQWIGVKLLETLPGMSAPASSGSTRATE